MTSMESSPSLFLAEVHRKPCRAKQLGEVDKADHRAYPIGWSVCDVAAGSLAIVSEET